jgi:hypothetical protein
MNRTLKTQPQEKPSQRSTKNHREDSPWVS